jgi:predicted DNA-binding transcriptional regulator AlpA
MVERDYINYVKHTNCISAADPADKHPLEVIPVVNAAYDRCFSVNTVSEITGYSRQTIHNLIKRGLLKARTTPGVRKVMIPEAEFRRYIGQQAPTPADTPALAAV